MDKTQGSREAMEATREDRWQAINLAIKGAAALTRDVDHVLTWQEDLTLAQREALTDAANQAELAYCALVKARGC